MIVAILDSIFCTGWFVKKNNLCFSQVSFHKTTKNQIPLITLITITGERAIICAEEHLLNQLK